MRSGILSTEPDAHLPDWGPPSTRSAPLVVSAPPSRAPFAGPSDMVGGTVVILGGALVLQVISVLGALAILAAYVANQLRFIGPANLSYSVMNFVGSAVLTVIAVVEVQWGFILLEGVWALASLWGMITVLRGGSPGETR